MGCCCSNEEDQYERPLPRGSSSGNRGGGQKLGGGGIDSGSGVDARDAAAQAAFERHNATAGAGATERDRKLLERRQKDDLVGKIHAYYAQMHRDPPIGLPASSIDQLRKHLDRVKAEARRGV